MSAHHRWVRPDSRRRVVAVFAVLATALAATPAADTHIYQSNGSGGGAKVGTVKDGSSQMAIVCNSNTAKSCVSSPTCDTCHATAPDANRFDAVQKSAHLQAHFPGRAMRLAAGRPIAFGDSFVELRDGRLVLLNARREPHSRLPVGALVLPDRAGAAASIVYSGDQPPAVIR